MKGIYLASFKALHEGYDIVYQDINGKRDIGGDMLEIDIEKYDYIIATPPCNYYSRANYRRDRSDYSIKTKHLLPCILDKLCKQKKPFIVENVRNSRLFLELKMYEYPCFIYEIGRHTYWTNVFLSTSDIGQQMEHIEEHRNQGGWNVHQVIEQFLQDIHKEY